jgi:hypothetical protein
VNRNGFALMRNRRLASLCALAIVILIPISLAGQSQRATAKRSVEAKTWTPPRTPWADPDLQGIWTNSDEAIVPIERPAEFEGRPLLTEEEAEQRATRSAERILNDGGTGSYAWYWRERGNSRRTSQIVIPPDGRLPPLTEEGRKRAAAREQARRGRGPSDSWEDRTLWERCITRGVPGAMIPTSYNNNYQILQVPGYVVILYEMIHDARIIPLDGYPHIGQRIRQWMGDSRGRWEGNTLVVDVTNFSDKAEFRGSGETLHVIERFKRADADTIDYQFTVDDPTQFTRPWTVALPLKRHDGYQIEYGCHEGNRGLESILSGARADEKAELPRTPR